MSLSTRLILFLTFAVGLVMLLCGFFILRQREEILARALRNELYAHAITLQLTLEDSYRAGRIGDTQRLINHLSVNPRVFSVILFDETGSVAMFSNPLEAEKMVESLEAQRVIKTGEPVEITQRRRGREVYSIIMPEPPAPNQRVTGRIVGDYPEETEIFLSTDEESDSPQGVPALSGWTIPWLDGWEILSVVEEG